MPCLQSNLKIDLGYRGHFYKIILDKVWTFYWFVGDKPNIPFLLGLDKMVYFTRQRQSVFVIFHLNSSCANITVQLFNHRKPKKHFNPKCVLALVAKFLEINLCNKQCYGSYCFGPRFYFKYQAVDNNFWYLAYKRLKKK